MGAYALAMGGMAVVLNRSGQRPGVDLVVKFPEHFAGITEALDELGLWDEADGLYYDRLKTPSGEAVPVRVRSMVGIIPALAAVVIGENDLRQSLTVGKRLRSPPITGARVKVSGCGDDARLVMSDRRLGLLLRCCARPQRVAGRWPAERVWRVWRQRGS